MVRRTCAEMEKTRTTLLATAQQFFGKHGYADTSMDDLTANAGLTRGALYHHFSDKKGLLVAVMDQIDAELDQRLQAISDSAEDAWEGFRRRCHAYLEMVLGLEPEIQRIVLRDAKAVLRQSLNAIASSRCSVLDRRRREWQCADRRGAAQLSNFPRHPPLCTCCATAPCVTPNSSAAALNLGAAVNLKGA